jgi:hypothetical protein
MITTHVGRKHTFNQSSLFKHWLYHDISLWWWCGFAHFR